MQAAPVAKGAMRAAQGVLARSGGDKFAPR